MSMPGFGPIGTEPIAVIPPGYGPDPSPSPSPRVVTVEARSRSLTVQFESRTQDVPQRNRQAAVLFVSRVVNAVL